MHRKKSAYVFTILSFLLISNTVFAFIEENFEFHFDVKNTTSKKSFIFLNLPSNVPKVGIEYKKISRPVLFIDFIAENRSAMDSVARRVNVRYSENETIVSHRQEDQKYICINDEHGFFKRGACFREAKLILPPDLEVSIFQNQVLVYSRADLKEIKKQYGF